MPKLTKIYTRGGDEGATSLGGGQRVPKHSLRIKAFGAVDELNSQIGLALACDPDVELTAALREIQNTLFHLGADLCVLESDKPRLDGPRVEQRHVDALEQLIDRLSVKLGPLENFILPGGSLGAAHLHVARTLCRRAERTTTALAEHEPIGPSVLKYLNRLSDALFVMARQENHRSGIDDICWNSRT